MKNKHAESTDLVALDDSDLDHVAGGFLSFSKAKTNIVNKTASLTIGDISVLADNGATANVSPITLTVN